MIEIINSVTGLKLDQKTLQEKIVKLSTIVRRFNLRESLKPEVDRLPKGLHKALRDTGQTITEEKLDFMLKDY